MSNPNYRPVSGFAPHEDDTQPLFQSPEMLAHPWRVSGGGQPYSPEYEMQQNSRPSLPPRPSSISFASDGSGLPQRSIMQETTYDHRPSLQAPQKTNSRDSVMTTASIKAKTGKQLRRLLVGSSLRWFISLLLCAAWVMSTYVFQGLGAVTETKKRWYNGATTGIALALGLNISSAFKDMALNMRWPILARRERNLVELDLILRADSLSELGKLVFATRRPGVILACIIWLALNIAAQAGIAAVNLTYGFQQDEVGVLLTSANTSTAAMGRFYPLGSTSVDDDEVASKTYEDQAYTAHQYSTLAQLFGYNETTELPKPGRRILPQDSNIFYNNVTRASTFVFYDENPGATSLNIVDIYTSRTINVTYECESHEVTSGGDGSTAIIDVANLGEVVVSQVLNTSTTFFQDNDSTCSNGNPRCSVLQAFEPSIYPEVTPHYYRCNITLGETQNDPDNISLVDDRMAYFATSALVIGAFVSNDLQSAILFPQSSYFGSIAGGDVDVMGVFLGMTTLSAIQGAAQYNPNKFYQGVAPSRGQSLVINHSLAFYGLLLLLLVCQAILVILVATWAKKVKVGEDSPIGMSVMMRGVADKLDDISHGKETKALKKAKRQTMVRWEQDLTGVWTFKMKTP